MTERETLHVLIRMWRGIDRLLEKIDNRVTETRKQKKANDDKT